MRAVHIIGAGLAGLSAAVRLASSGIPVTVYEAANQAGGRCRSYHDPILDMTIDNGNHLLLSGNQAALSYLEKIGALDRVTGPSKAEFPFVDLASGERWTLRPNDGRLPWWLFARQRRVPGTRSLDYLVLLRFLWAGPHKAIGDVLDCKGTLYERLIDPFFRAVLNTEPQKASAALAWAVLRESLAAGGRNYRPLVAQGGLSSAFVEPALRFVETHGGALALSQRLRALAFDDDHITALDFAGASVPLAKEDAVILAVPPAVAASLVPELITPVESRTIVNAHFRIPVPAGVAPITGVINGEIEWLFAFPDRLSVTISAADRLLETPREELASRIWEEVAEVADIVSPMPPWQIIRERRATFAALPQEDAKRPSAHTRWRNLVLAGDWTATGLPATIEGAVRSGNRAAELILNTSAP
ncbi:hydroxysqualene dehydroxylase HpnE [Mesorhizobium sp. BAC0120]|uniref:hydroxysqualene dehydroxylase HpnE n=1 Tax=Mesorhizobium sp. BAC0120 TaxID=3090670 RepID=UPI00298C8ED8|nr:hydroxysqualene dehydroxylase HpnE [Mesorhizobium sp. BAC0120]MDW6026152.1 hydroxysqualene dehydroxylase HpnE [Mesorhizobium sp. BAC0120]